MYPRPEFEHKTKLSTYDFLNKWQICINSVAAFISVNNLNNKVDAIVLPSMLIIISVALVTYNSYFGFSWLLSV
jgi:hypothetical protein